MMMTQPFPAHQGIPQHPGVPPGHPMAQAQHPNMVQPGMVQHMHPGVSAAGGPQVSQPGPMMAGMPPGGTTGPGGPVPNAHALQHLNPAAQAHLLQQQPYGMNVSNNNQLLQQQAIVRQQRMLQQQHLAQQQQHHAGGIPVSMPAGTQGLSQAQLSAMQNPNMRGPVNMMHFQQQMQHMPPNIQQQQFLHMQAQAQAQAAAAQAAQAQANSQQGQHTPQQRAAVVPPQSVTPQPQQGPPGPPGSATPSQQSNPPQHSTPQPPSHQGSQPPQSTPNPQHQQIPQAQQAMAQQQSQQQAQVNQQQQQVQQPQAQPQNGQPQVTQPQQQAQLNQQQQAMATPEQLKMQQQMMMEQQRRVNMNSFLQNKGTLTHFVNSYFETLSTFQSNGEDADLVYWQEVVNKYYNTTFQPMTGQPWGVLRQGVLTAGTGLKSFEVNATILPRYYVTLFNNGIRRIQTHMEATQEFSPQNGYRVVFSPKASFIYWFANDCQLFVNGSLKVLVNPDYKFDLVDISVSGFREFIPRNLLQQPEPIDQKPSPRVAKNASKRMQKQQLAQPTISPPESLVNENGLPASVQCFLEIAEPLSYMTSLISHSASNPHKSASELLRDVTALISQTGMNSGALQAQAQGQRTPSLNGPSQFASPSVVNMGLPGAQASPHLGNSAHPSPAQNHLMGPGMMPQQSQGSLAANGSQGASANTSPNVSNKRRRASTVKTEGDDGVEVNGAGPTGAAKVRASPKVGGKRHKGTA